MTDPSDGCNAMISAAVLISHMLERLISNRNPSLRPSQPLDEGT